jgi:hypothetical protein
MTTKGVRLPYILGSELEVGSGGNLCTFSSLGNRFPYNTS